ncbi:MAG: ATP-grasp domain-containing protein, partial [Acidobacteria bacterium]|nr:ATP-grasp domain-containing protein [Acidobacteriota bacterium]
MATDRKRCSVLYNLVGDDEFEKYRHIDPASLPFKPEYPLDVRTAREEYEAIAHALENAGYSVELHNLEDDFDRLRNLLDGDPPDVIFNLVEIFNGEPRLESAITGLFELFGIPYTGSTPFTLGLCQRKALTKHVLASQKIPTPRFRLLRRPTKLRRHGLHYPIIVKPAREDASLGVEPESVVYDARQLAERVSAVYEKFRQPVLLEEFIQGPELHVSILGNNPPKALPIIEYDFSELPQDHPPIITYDIKWNPTELVYHRVYSTCPAELPKSAARRVAEVALEAYQAVYCRDYARVDIRLSEDRRPYILEVNPNPDLTEGV